jgi:SET domain
MNPLDVSELLFHRTDSTKVVATDVGQHDDRCSNVNHNIHQRFTFVGPISIIPHSSSTSTNPTTPTKGRCLVATRKLDVGELLFVTPPIVNANVQRIWDEYYERRTSHDNLSLAECAEHILLNVCKDAIAKNDHGVIHCLTALERCQRSGNDEGADDVSCPTSCSIRRLLGQTDKNSNDDELPDNNNTSNSIPLSDDDIIQIIRRNAFGSDFPTTNRVEQRWLEVLDNINSPGTNNSDVNSVDSHTKMLPSRLLGIYGLAALINHSCIPNAVRVFSSDCMIVHSCQPIQEGEEIVWSYIPVIQPYQERQLLLQQTHNFACLCPRCRCEAMLLTSNSNLKNQLRDIQSVQQETKNFSAADVVHRLENEILKEPSLTNELKRFIRISYMQSYMNYINDTLSMILDNDSKDDVAALQKLLTLAFQLHLAFVACHNVSTEHLSVRFGYFFCFGSAHYRCIP